MVYSLYYSIMTRKGWHHIYMVGSLLHTFKKGDSISKKHTASQLPGYGQCLTLAYISQRLIRVLFAQRQQHKADMNYW